MFTSILVCERSVKLLQTIVRYIPCGGARYRWLG